MFGKFDKFDKLKKFKKLIRRRRISSLENSGPEYEFCPRCNANLTLQKGYDNSFPYWLCLGCGEMLINPAVESESDIVWICDDCGAMLNIQPGFHEDCGKWKCMNCGFVNNIAKSEVYASEADFMSYQRNPYKGLSDSQVLELSFYLEEKKIDGRDDVVLVRHRENGKRFVKKLLTAYNKSIYAYLKEYPISHMPRIISLYEGDNRLIVIEEYVPGSTVYELLKNGGISEKRAIAIARDVVSILDEMHQLPTPIIHRDVKPSNIIVTPDNEVVLLDMNAAKWYDPDKADDTRYMGTRFFAAPEQAGYGLSSSSAKADIYAVGVLMNVMLTGCFPKEKRAFGKIWKIIEKCISLNAEDRYTAAELKSILDEINL